MRKDNSLAKKQSVSLKTLCKHPLAIMSYDQNDFSVNDALFHSYSDTLKIAFRSNNHKLLYNYVLSTDCIGLTHLAHTSDFNAQSMMQSDISLIPVKDLPYSKFIAFYKKDHPKYPLIRLFIDALLQNIAQTK